MSGWGTPKALNAVPSQALRASKYMGRQGGKRQGTGAEPDLSQALCPGDTPLHKDLPGELVVHELFSSVLQEICDEVSEGWPRRAGKTGGGRTCQNSTGVGWREGLALSGELGLAARHERSGILALISERLKLLLFRGEQ